MDLQLWTQQKAAAIWGAIWPSHVVIVCKLLIMSLINEAFVVSQLWLNKQISPPIYLWSFNEANHGDLLKKYFNQQLCATDQHLPCQVQGHKSRSLMSPERKRRTKKKKKKRGHRFFFSSVLLTWRCLFTSQGSNTIHSTRETKGEECTANSKSCASTVFGSQLCSVWEEELRWVQAKAERGRVSTFLKNQGFQHSWGQKPKNSVRLYLLFK